MYCAFALVGLLLGGLAGFVLARLLKVPRLNEVEVGRVGDQPIIRYEHNLLFGLLTLGLPFLGVCACGGIGALGQAAIDQAAASAALQKEFEPLAGEWLVEDVVVGNLQPYESRQKLRASQDYVCLGQDARLTVEPGKFAVEREGCSDRGELKLGNVSTSGVYENKGERLTFNVTDGRNRGRTLDSAYRRDGGKLVLTFGPVAYHLKRAGRKD